MNWKILVAYPYWFILLCLLLGLAYAMVLYLRERKNEYTASLRWVLAAFRFMSVSVISFLLLSPFLKTVSRFKEKPVVIIAQDDSRSVALGPDSAFYRGEYLAELDNLAGSLSDFADVRRYTFGESVRQLDPGSDFRNTVKYDGRLTDMSGMLSELDNLYSNRNVGALVIASDGIFNTGSNPLYMAARWPYPIYTIALGDTAVKRDLLLSRVNFNRLVYLNNKFPLQAIIHAHDCSGKKTVLRVSEGDRELFQKEVFINEDNFTTEVDVILNADKTGLRKFRISLDPVEDELSTRNNTRDVFVEVLDARIRILVLSDAPHPDISALRQSIENNLNYEVETFQAKDFITAADKYNLVILHGLPSLDNPIRNILSDLGEKKIPVLYILSGSTDLNQFDQLNLGLKITSQRRITEEAEPELDPGFMLFSLSEETAMQISEFPPLLAPVGDYQSGQGLNNLLYQRIGSIITTRPLMTFSETLDYRYGIITGEGIWKWRLTNFARTNDHQAFDELFNKIFQFLSVRALKKNFRVYHAGNYLENERIIFDAEVYNDAYELVTGPEVEMVITDEEGTQFRFIFTQAGKAYRLDAGSFPPGNYSYQATVKVGEKTYRENGQFSVTRLDQEALSATADHALLYSLSGGKQGDMFLPSQMGSLKDTIETREDVKPLIYVQKRFREMISIGWLLGWIILLLSVEWFIRKRAGGY